MSQPFKLSLFLVNAELPEIHEETQNLKNYLHSVLDKNFELEVIDVLKSPERAVKEGVFATPTLLRGTPPPPLRVVGDFTNGPKVLAALELNPS